MKPLRNLLLVKQNEVFKEEKTSSGLYIVRGEASTYNFKDDDTGKLDVIHKNKFSKKDLNNALIEHSKKATGNHIEFYPGGGEVNLRQLENDEKLKDIVYGRSHNSGIIISNGRQCAFSSEGDNIIFKKSARRVDAEDGNFLISEDDILLIDNEDKKTVHPNCVVVKITKESRENIYKRKVKTDNGEEITLFLPTPVDSVDESQSRFFVTCGEIVEIGENVEGVEKGDIAILDYLCDNDENIIVGYEGEDKLIVISAVTKRHTTTEIAYKNQVSHRDQIVHQVGDYEFMSQLLGVIRGSELLPIEPYVFLNHKSTVVSKKTKSGIEYTEDEKIIEREVIAISKISEKRINIKKGDRIIIDDFDLFAVELNGKIVSCTNDIDIIGKPDNNCRTIHCSTNNFL